MGGLNVQVQSVDPEGSAAGLLATGEKITRINGSETATVSSLSEGECAR